MTSSLSLVVGSGKSSDVPSEASAATLGTVVRYKHDEFPGHQYRPSAVTPEARSNGQRRLLLAAGYSEQAAEARSIAEQSMAAQGEVLGDAD